MDNLLLNTLRREYQGGALTKQQAAKDPIAQFECWLTDAINQNVDLPNAMALATVDPKTQKPSMRMVLMKAVNRDGFTFYSSQSSQKGQEIAENTNAALLFYWPALDRQVRIEGSVTLLSEKTAAAYHKTRPRQSQLASWVAEQSSVLTDRQALTQGMASCSARFEKVEIPKPKTWIGFCLCPERFEFWQGQPNRLHDRLCYQQAPDRSWQITRLAP